MTRQQFDELTAKGVVILDGATGSNLRKAGMPVGISSEQWVLENPSVLQNCSVPMWMPEARSYMLLHSQPILSA